MKQILLSTIILCGLIGVAKAQGNSSGLTGPQLLRLARSNYDQGRLFDIPTLLEEPIVKSKDKHTNKESRLTDSEITEALQILILTYIYLEEPQKADQKMIELLNHDKFFELTKTEPIEFQKLYGKFRIDPIFRIAIKVGVNKTYINTISNQYILGSSQGKGVYSANTGLQYGISFERDLNKHKMIVLNPEIFFNTQSVNYINNDAYMSDASVDNISTAASMHHKITQQRIQLNALSQFILGYKKAKGKYNNIANRPITPYLVAGPAISYLYKSSFLGETTLESKDKITGAAINNTDRYNGLNLSLIVGGGIRYLIGNIYITAEIKYQYGFLNVVNSKNRYKETSPDINRIIHQYSYVDNDFTMRNGIFNVGIVKPIFKPKKLSK
jgi:hypothetical protein